VRQNALFDFVFWFGRLNQHDNNESEAALLLAFASGAITLERAVNVFTAQQINSNFESLKSAGFNPSPLERSVRHRLLVSGEIFAEECPGLMARH